jgi:hypothetical protein
LVYDENWEYQKNISFANNSLAYAIEIENELYLTGDESVYKTDKSLNIINASYNNGSAYRGIYYNKTSDLIYVADVNLYSIKSEFHEKYLIVLGSIVETMNNSVCIVKRMYYF